MIEILRDLNIIDRPKKNDIGNTCSGPNIYRIAPCINLKGSNPTSICEAQYGLIKQYTLNQIMDPHII